MNWQRIGILALGLLGTGATFEEEPSSDIRMPVGMNLRMVGPRSREWVFVDVMKTASAWRYDDGASARRRGRSPGSGRRAGSPGGGQGRQDPSLSPEERRRRRLEARQADLVPTDARGWPLPEGGRAVTASMMAEQDGRYPGGTYVCTWEGSGTITFDRAARVKERQDHRLLVEIDPARGEIAMHIADIDPEDPVHDVRLWMPGFEDAESPFHPLFIERLQPFSVLRFYPWMRPFSSSGRWDARPTPADARQSDDDGVAVEYMVGLCNELRAEPWFCIPHTADDEYVREFAQLVRATLRPDARVWVELSNELWNSSFVQAQWMRAEAQRRGITTAELTSSEAARVFRIFREVFAEDAERVVRVAAGQLHNPGIARALCRGLGEEVDAIAVGAYFGARPERPERPERSGRPARDTGPAGGVARGASPTELLEAARENLETVVLQRIADHKKLADQVSQRLGRHVMLVAYEGGQHLVSHGSGGGAAFSAQVTAAVQDHPGMYDAYRRLLDGSHERGLELFCAYDFVGQRTHADTFGHLRFLDEPLSAAPKFRALVEDWLEESREAR